MMLTEETAIPPEALPVADFRAHLRMGSGFADDDVQDPVLESFLRAAMAAIEARTGKILLQRVFAQIVSDWSNPAGHALPVAPVSAVLRVVLRDPRHEDELIDPSWYRLQPDLQRPVLRPAGTVLPVIAAGGSAEVVFQAGHATEWARLPADLAQAVMLLASHYYEHRDETALGSGCMPFGVTSLIERYRTVRIFIGGAGA